MTSALGIALLILAFLSPPAIVTALYYWEIRNPTRARPMLYLSLILYLPLLLFPPAYILLAAALRLMTEKISKFECVFCKEKTLIRSIGTSLKFGRADLLRECTNCHRIQYSARLITPPVMCPKCNVNENRVVITSEGKLAEVCGVCREYLATHEDATSINDLIRANKKKNWHCPTCEKKIDLLEIVIGKYTKDGNMILLCDKCGTLCWLKQTAPWEDHVRRVGTPEWTGKMKFHGMVILSSLVACIIALTFLTGLIKILMTSIIFLLFLSSLAILFKKYKLASRKTLPSSYIN